MSKRKRRKQSKSQVVLTLLSLLLVGSMVISFVIVAFQPPAPTPTPWPTFTPLLPPTSSPVPTATDLPIAEPTWIAPQPTATSEPTEPVVGPELPTASPTVSPTLTITPSGARIDFSLAVCEDSRDYSETHQKVPDVVRADGIEFLVHTGDVLNRRREWTESWMGAWRTGAPLRRTTHFG